MRQDRFGKVRINALKCSIQLLKNPNIVKVRQPAADKVGQYTGKCVKVLQCKNCCARRCQGYFPTILGIPYARKTLYKASIRFYNMMNKNTTPRIFQKPESASRHRVSASILPVPPRRVRPSLAGHQK
jgi:hypothetical protein